VPLTLQYLEALNFDNGLFSAGCVPLRRARNLCVPIIPAAFPSQIAISAAVQNAGNVLFWTTRLPSLPRTLQLLRSAGLGRVQFRNLRSKHIHSMVVLPPSSAPIRSCVKLPSLACFSSSDSSAAGISAARMIRIPLAVKCLDASGA
jgi:hypothetical protein